MSEEIMIDDEMGLKEGPQYLLFYLNTHRFALDAQNIAEIVELPEITKVPWMQESIRGVCNIRGSVVGVIDPSKLLMNEEYNLTRKSSLVIVNVTDQDTQEKIGIIVDEVYEIEVFEKEQFQDVPGYGLPVDIKYIEAMITYGDQFIPLLSTSKVLDIDSLKKRETYEE